ncbi:MAG: pyridoxamine 5'-phosphate oxidase family protein [Actinomycetota bacterium]|nr:pyridoxamine 5'-phosphate oxidase family protein [Actinomycetota bacterium]
MTLTLRSTQDPSTRQPLTRAACLALLALGGDGRVAATKRSLPIIIPVRFTLFGDDIVFSPGPGESLSPAIANSVVAFQADHIGSDGTALWGVHVTAVARTLADGPEAPTFRLSSEIITGWRAGS